MNNATVPFFDRYRDIIPDYGKFLEALDEPFPVTIRVNTLKISIDTFRNTMAEEGYRTEPCPGVEEAFILRGMESPGATLEYSLGYYHVQSLASMLPPKILNPLAGETLLDLCAAPGGKATHLAQLMENRGLLVANEVNGHRSNILQNHINRLGATSILVCRYDGLSFPTRMKFNRLLLDPPCSAEGTYRSGPPSLWSQDAGSIERLALLQKKLLRRALDLLLPGGILVYSTCTYAPEENEAVINDALVSGMAEILPISIPFPHSQGLTDWGGETFHGDMSRAVRIYPHQLNSRGFFIARLRKRS